MTENKKEMPADGRFSPEQEKQLCSLFAEMIRFDAGDPKRIQHFMKVHSFARQIAMEEGMDTQTRFVLEAAAYVHDIGIHPAEEKYGYQNGKLQEQEGPAPAGEMLTRLGFTEDVVERVQYLVGHHHTYKNIDGLDYQALVEADFLVNLYEDGESLDAIRNVGEKIFRTESGRWILKEMFGV